MSFTKFSFDLIFLNSSMIFSGLISSEKTFFNFVSTMFFHRWTLARISITVACNLKSPTFLMTEIKDFLGYEVLPYINWRFSLSLVKSSLFSLLFLNRAQTFSAHCLRMKRLVSLIIPLINSPKKIGPSILRPVFELQSVNVTQRKLDNNLSHCGLGFCVMFPLIVL